MTELICITCPKGCRLRAELMDGDLSVSGQGCARGVDYARAELINPVRMVSSTVRLLGSADYRRLPVRTSRPVPKSAVRAIMQALERAQARAPVVLGQVILPDVCGTGADIVATRSV